MDFKSIVITNPNTRVFGCGDVHGKYKLLMARLKEVNFDKNKDLLIGTGDIIDRGEQNEDMLQLIQEPWFESCLGNHEDMAEKGLFSQNLDEKNENLHMWLNHGGEWFQELLEHDKSRIKATIQKVVPTLPYLLEVNLYSGKKVGFAHARVPGLDWNKVISSPLSPLQREATLYDRGVARDIECALEEPWDDWEEDYFVKNIDHVYLGHTPFKKPMHAVNLSFIDTHAYASDNLTLIQIA